MRIRKFGHSCVQVMDGDANLLIDPGTYSSGYDVGGDAARGLTAVLITHMHADHLDPAGLARVLAANPDAAVYCDAASAEVVGTQVAGARAVGAEAPDAEAPRPAVSVTVVEPGDHLDLGTPVTVFGGEHAVIHADVPRAINVGYLIGKAGSVFCHPGDSLVVPDVPVEVLATPVSAPWMAVKEGVDYLRAVAPERALPIHEKVLASVDMTYRLFGQLAPAGTRWIVIDDGTLLEV